MDGRCPTVGLVCTITLMLVLVNIAMRAAVMSVGGFAAEVIGLGVFVAFLLFLGPKYPSGHFSVLRSIVPGTLVLWQEFARVKRSRY